MNVWLEHNYMCILLLVYVPPAKRLGGDCGGYCIGGGCRLHDPTSFAFWRNDKRKRQTVSFSLNFSIFCTLFFIIFYMFCIFFFHILAICFFSYCSFFFSKFYFFFNFNFNIYFYIFYDVVHEFPDGFVGVSFYFFFPWVFWYYTLWPS